MIICGPKCHRNQFSVLQRQSNHQYDKMKINIGKQKGYKRPMTLKKTIEQHKYTILFCLILVFGSILRLVQLGKVPGGYQMDEAYGAFNAYSLFHSGIDSTGHSYPVYFESWGGGQNALNSYLMLPLMVFTGGKITPCLLYTSPSPRD